jgi:hypothetical protein
MSSDHLMIEFAAGRTAYKPGDTVAGHASWQVAHAKSVEVRFFWYTSGTGTPAVQIIAATKLDHPRPNGQTPFKYQLPESPYSFSGRLIRLAWAVELVIEPGNLSTRAEFVMAPGERETLLDSLPKKP